MRISTNDTFIPVNQPEYEQHFFDYLKGQAGGEAYLEAGNSDGGYDFPTVTDKKLTDRLKEESLFRRFSTCLYSPGASSDIKARMNTDSASWVAAGGTIPVYDGLTDFTDYTISDHKLAIVLKMDESFLHDNKYSFESYLMERLSGNFARAEEKAFVAGNGTTEPVGILHGTSGAQTGVTAESLTFDSVIGLYFSVDKEYRQNGVWLMNDSTAFALRKLKDGDNNYLWNHANDTILGKPVYISNEMPDADSGKKPIAFGDFRYYWIVDRSRIHIRVLREKFFETLQIGYLANERLDAKLIRPQAIKVLKIA